MARKIALTFALLIGTLTLALSLVRAETDYAKQTGEQSAFARHKLVVKLRLKEHKLNVFDKVTLRERKEREVAFYLRDTMEFYKLLWLENGNERDVSVIRSEEEDGKPEHLVKYVMSVPKECDEILFAYTGEIYDPVEEEAALAHVRGDFTSGIIAPEGIYLDAGSGWYPTEQKNLATFSLSVSVEKPIILVAQGDLVERSETAEWNWSTWHSDVPQDGLTLVGNEFVESTRDVNGVSISTYFFEEDNALSEKFLDATEKYLKFYTNLLGEFPYNRFDIVENFFQTGYGMPGYTLLGDRVIKMSAGGGYDVTGPSGIAHELMHNWWGNSVFFDADKGNWCEAITTYLTNYYWLEASGQEEEALKWRKHASVKYSISAPPEEAYPLVEFRGKRNEVDGAVGYEKGAMFFHFLRKLIGDDAFFEGLRQVIREHSGGFATWEDFERAFREQAEGISSEKEPFRAAQAGKLEAIFQQWLMRADAPSFWIESADYAVEPEGEPTLSLKFAQREPPWTLQIPYTIQNAEGKTTTWGGMPLDGSSAEWSIGGT